MPEAKKEKVPYDDSAFQTLEKEFQETLAELLGDGSLGKFRTEYEKLFKVLRKSHDSERRLMNRCRDLNNEIIGNSAKVAASLKLSEQDQETIASLKQEIGKTWKLVDAAHEKELRSRETIQSLRKEIANLSSLVEQGVGMLPGQETSLNELLKVKEELMKERDEHLQEISGLREKVTEATDKLTVMEKKKTVIEDKVLELTKDVQDRSNELQREKRKRDRLERELRQAQADLDARAGDMKSLAAQLEKTRTDLFLQERVFREEKTISERTLKDAEMLGQRCDKLRTELEEQVKAADALASENQACTAHIKEKEDELHTVKAETQKLTRLTETVQRKLRQVEDQKADVEHERETLRNQVLAMEKELDAAKREATADKKAVEQFKRERDNLNKNILKAQGITEQQTHLVKVHEQSRAILEQEIAGYKEEAQKQRKIIYQLELERDRYINEASDLTQKVLQHMKELKVRELHIFDLKKKMAEADTKLKQQHNLYDAVRLDRNLYSKNLIECQDELTEKKRKLTLMTHQVTQLREEIKDKESALLKEQLGHRTVEKEKTALKEEMQRMKRQMAENRAYLETSQAEQHKLLQVITQADALRLRQKKDLDQVMSERDILGSQLVRRNDELSLLYEKTKLQASLLQRGEKQYNQRLLDLRLLKMEIRNLRRHNNILKNRTACLHELQRDVQHTEAQLLKEQARCRALEEEMENPQNIHRWRTLQGLDPSTYELLLKTQTLQKRLLLKTEEVVEKELVVQQRERLYLQLRDILARQPGPEAAEQLVLHQATLRRKTKQIKALASELNMHEAEVTEYKFKLETVGQELNEMKKKYFRLKKQEQKSKENTRAVTPGLSSIHSHPSHLPRFTGGGFNLQAAKYAARPASSNDTLLISSV